MALKAYGENVFYTSRQYGHMDLRNSLGLYNLSRVFQAQVCDQMNVNLMIPNMKLLSKDNYCHYLYLLLQFLEWSHSNKGREWAVPRAPPNSAKEANVGKGVYELLCNILQ